MPTEENTKNYVMGMREALLCVAWRGAPRRSAPCWRSEAGVSFCSQKLRRSLHEAARSHNSCDWGNWPPRREGVQFDAVKEELLAGAVTDIGRFARDIGCIGVPAAWGAPSASSPADDRTPLLAGPSTALIIAPPSLERSAPIDSTAPQRFDTRAAWGSMLANSCV